MLEHRAFRSIAAQFGVSASALLRHHDEHLPAGLVQSVKAAEISRADDLVDRLVEIARETQAALERARDAGDDELMLKAVARAEKQIELQAKLAGQLQAAPVINLTLSPEWLSIQAVIVNALDPFPEARLRVAQALEAVKVVDARHGH